MNEPLHVYSYTKLQARRCEAELWVTILSFGHTEVTSEAVQRRYKRLYKVMAWLFAWRGYQVQEVSEDAQRR